jgi:hypothetical protein
MSISADYDQDFFAWITHNVQLLRSGRLSELDAEHVAEELESMGKRDLRQLRSRLQVLIMHLLKWEHQPDKRGPSWLRTIDHQRDEIEALLLDSPSLRPRLAEASAQIYAKAVRDAARETGLAEDAFPHECPYELDDMLAAGFLPD